ncbi:MAG: hypothetical protein WCI74_01280 [Actinomycetes bacterium]
MTPPSHPRQRLLDAAMEVVGADGLRGLTHRRIEQQAGMARGSARYHLGARDDIIAALLEYSAVTEFAMIERRLARVGADFLVGTTVSLPSVAAALVAALLEDPPRVRARYELLLEASRRPSLRAEARRWRDYFVQAAEQALASAGVADPGNAAVLLVATLDGVTLDAVLSDRKEAPELARLAASALLNGGPSGAGLRAGM